MSNKRESRRTGARNGLLERPYGEPANANHEGQALRNGLLERPYGEQANANHEGQAQRNGLLEKPQNANREGQLKRKLWFPDLRTLPDSDWSAKPYF